MPRRHRRDGRPDPSAGRALILSLANRVSAMGMAVVVLVGLAMAAIVERSLMPTSARQRSATTPITPSPQGTSRRKPPSRTASSHVPASPATLLTRKVQNIALAERGAAARKQYGGGSVGTPVVRLSRIDHRRTWAFGTEAIPPPSGTTAMPDSSLYLAHATGTGGWEVALAGTPQFTALLRKAPTTVVPAAERPALENYSTAANIPQDPGLMLPWAVGQSWSLLPTDNAGVSGFDGGDGRVLAAGDGRLYRLCSSAPGHGLIILIHPNGLATEYYQMSDVTRVPDGSLVKRGDYLGQTSTEQACGGGDAPQRMARFAVRDADTMIPLDQVRIGGWTLHQTPTGSFADRAGIRVDAGNPVLNFGAPTPPSPKPSASASPGQKPGNGRPSGNPDGKKKPKVTPPTTGKPNGNA